MTFIAFDSQSTHADLTSNSLLKLCGIHRHWNTVPSWLPFVWPVCWPSRFTPHKRQNCLETRQAMAACIHLAQCLLLLGPGIAAHKTVRWEEFLPAWATVPSKRFPELDRDPTWGGVLNFTAHVERAGSSVGCKQGLSVERQRSKSLNFPVPMCRICVWI
jgi:hypothetical protein